MASTKYADEAKKREQAYTDTRKTQAEEQTALVDQSAADAVARAERDTAKQVKEADRAYVDMINDADIQKELDIRNIRETRANMGLSRSGLASTEMTAATLSAGNKTAAAQRQRQSAIDALNKSLLDYKAEAEANRNAQNLNIKQEADTDILNYKDMWSKWGMENDMRVDENNESTRRNGILSLNISDDIKTKAIENGWTVSQAAAEGKRVADETESTRRNSLYTAYQKGDISYEIYTQALADPAYDLDDAVAAQAVSNAEESAATKKYNESYALEMLSDGLIDHATYSQALKEGWNVEKISVAAQEGSAKKKNEAFAAAMLESGAIDYALYATALRANWDPETLATQMQKNATGKETARKQSLDAACSSGIITEYVRDYAKVNGLTLEQAKLAQSEMNSQSANAENEAKAEKKRLEELDVLYDNGGENGIIDPDVWLMARENGWSGSYALEYQKNKEELKAALEDGLITQEAYDDALVNGYAEDSVISIEKAKKEREATYNKILYTAKKLMYNKTATTSSGRERNIYSESGRKDAMAYLFRLYSSNYIDAETADRIASELGFSPEELTVYANENEVVAPSVASENKWFIPVPLMGDKNAQPGSKPTRGDLLK